MRKHLFAAAVFLCCLSLALPCRAEYDPSVVQQVQEKLNAQGFDCGRPDGVAGNRTAQAIRAYQQSMDLPVNGEITEELLRALGLIEDGQEPEETVPEETTPGETTPEETTPGEITPEETLPGENASGENAFDAYLEPYGDRYFTPGKEVLLFNLDGLKVILKDARIEYGFTIIMDVEVVNDHDQTFNIDYGMYFDGNELPDDDSDYVNGTLYDAKPGSAVERQMESYSDKEISSLPELENVQLYFSIFNSSYFTLMRDVGPIIVHFLPSSQSDAANGAEAVGPSTACIAGGDYETPPEGRWISPAPEGVLSHTVQLCVPGAWNRVSTGLNGFTAELFLSAEDIAQTRSAMLAHPGEVCQPAPEGLAVFTVSDSQMAESLRQTAEEAGSALIADGEGIKVYEMSGALGAENAVKSLLFSHAGGLTPAGGDAALWIYDEANASGMLIWADSGNQAAVGAVSSLRIPANAAETAGSTPDSGESISVDFEEAGDIPNELTEAFGGIPDTVDELRENVLTCLQFDIEQLADIYEQSDVEGMYKQLRETKQCTVPVLNGEWYGWLTCYDESDEQEDYEVTFSCRDGGVEAIIPDSVDLSDCAACTISLFCQFDDDYQVRIDLRTSYDEDGQQHLSGSTGLWAYAWSDESSYDYSIDYQSSGVYSVNLYSDSGELSRSWWGAYGEDGALAYIDSEVYANSYYE